MTARAMGAAVRPPIPTSGSRLKPEIKGNVGAKALITMKTYEYIMLDSCLVCRPTISEMPVYRRAGVIGRPPTSPSLGSNVHPHDLIVLSTLLFGRLWFYSVKSKACGPSGLEPLPSPTLSHEYRQTNKPKQSPSRPARSFQYSLARIPIKKSVAEKIIVLVFYSFT
ncbi:hypothetical protein J6590_013138 [Homalodisca vitripennis]|nr:hypothetical protein J6590_013138 [Homalodisca vitripennis]